MFAYVLYFSEDEFKDLLQSLKGILCERCQT